VTSIEWRGREVESPLVRRLALAFVILFGAALLVAGVTVAVIGTFLTLFLAVLSLPLHLVLRLLGRRGFFTASAGRARFALGLGGFRKAP
jgi:hypothetical protein